MMTTVKDVLSFFDRLWKALPNDHVALVFWTAVLVGMAVVIGFSLAHWLTKHRIELAQLQHQRELNQLTAASFSEKTVLAVREERSAMASPSPAPEPANERDSLEVEPLTLGAFVSAREAFERSSADATQLQMEAFERSYAGKRFTWRGFVHNVSALGNSPVVVLNSKPGSPDLQVCLLRDSEMSKAKLLERKQQITVTGVFSENGVLRDSSILD